MADTVFRLDDSVDLLRRTPGVLRGLLEGLGEGWLASDEGEGTWTPVDVLRHFVHGEVEDWIPRTEHALAHGAERPFPPFDHTRREIVADDPDADALLGRFASLRRDNLARLDELVTDESLLDTPASHPAFGQVTLRMHLATWAVHDLDHLRQMTRAMALRYEAEVGPWRQFLGVLD